jgi:sn1-specific diacylglycerol lipase
LSLQGIDLVPTDIAAGLILVQEDQDRRGLDEGYVMSPSDVVVEGGADGPDATPGSPRAPIEDWLDINRMIRYLKFAQAAFGWPLYLVLNDCSGPCELAKHYRYVTVMLVYMSRDNDLKRISVFISRNFLRSSLFRCP